jgi:ankyrin repeat protein
MVLVFHIMAWSESARAESTRQEIRSTDAEGEIYKQWYDAFKDRSLPRVIELGEAYLQLYPEGKYAAFLKQIIAFAHTSLDPARLRAAPHFRSQVKNSISNRLELESLLDEALNQHGDVNTKSSTGQTGLMWAAFNGDTQSVKVLVQKNVDLDATESSHGWTPLVYAIWGGDHFLVRNLLEYYPDVSIKDKEGRTALDHAIGTGDFEMMLLINGRPLKGQFAH